MVPRSEPPLVSRGSGSACVCDGAKLDLDLKFPPAAFGEERDYVFEYLARQINAPLYATDLNWQEESEREV